MAPGPLATALQGHDMFLYFGHGSGDQYLSARYSTTCFTRLDQQFTCSLLVSAAMIGYILHHSLTHASGSSVVIARQVHLTCRPHLACLIAASNCTCRKQADATNKRTKVCAHVRALRRMPRCASALLMGCSSGNLAAAGQYEPTGPVLAYLMAGTYTYCKTTVWLPAMTLWLTLRLHMLPARNVMYD